MLCVCFSNDKDYEKVLNMCIGESKDICELNVEISFNEVSFVVFPCNRCNCISLVPKEAYEEPFYIVDKVISNFINSILTRESYLLDLVKTFLKYNVDVVVVGVLDPCVRLVPSLDYYSDVRMIFFRDYSNFDKYVRRFEVVRRIFIEFLLRHWDLARKLAISLTSVPSNMIFSYLVEKGAYEKFFEIIDKLFEKVFLRDLCGDKCVMYVKKV